MRTRLMGWMTVAAGVCLSLLAATPAWAQGKTAYTIKYNSGPLTLLTINTANPDVPIAAVPITGYNGLETLVDLDIRPSNGMLYALGVDSVNDTMTLYLLSTRTGVATAVGAGSFAGAGNLPSTFDTRYAIDFDPTTDRLRVITSGLPFPAATGLNFRVNPNTGTLDQADPDINPTGIYLQGVAYTNNGLASTVTSLYTVSGDTLYIQTPVNGGTQTQAVTLNKQLYINGFDFDADAVTSASGTPVGAGSSEAYLTGTDGMLVMGLWRINLLTGEVGPRMQIAGSSNTTVRGLAVQPYEPGELPAYALNTNGLSLFRFNTASPGVVTEAIINPAGIVAGDVLSAIDFRPQTGQLYALGSNQVNNTVQLYLVDPWTNAGGTTASVTALGAPIAVTAGSNGFGFDFNPTVDRIRVITNAGDNFRINPNTGALAGTDTPINPAGAFVSGAAYTNSFGQDLSAGLPTTLYTLDVASERIAIQNSPNGGTQTQFHTVTLAGPPIGGINSVNGFDIPGSVQTLTANGAVTGQAYALLNRTGMAMLVKIELSTGVATFVGVVGNGTIPMSGLALGDNFSRTVTTTTVVGAPNPAMVFAPVTITATVTPAEADGTVGFSISGQPISGCTAAPLTAGVATCQTTFSSHTSFLTTGGFLIAATYSGSAGYLPSSATSAPLKINPILTTTTLTVTPVFAAGLGEPVTLTATVTPEGATGTVRFVRNDVVTDDASIGFAPLVGNKATLTTATLPPGTRWLFAQYSGSDSHGASSSHPIILRVGEFRQHFAEGATGGFFQTDIGVVNASATKTAKVKVRLFPENVSALTLDFTLAPLARRSLDLNALLGGLNIAGGVSTSIESDQPIAATRQMTWGTPVYGSTLESGVSDTGRTWYFAEGATNPYSLYYLIENPSALEAQVTFTHLLEGGAAPIVWNDTVAPFARRTFFINDVAGAGNASLSTAIASNVPIVAERAMYLNTTSRQWEGGTASAGAPSLSTTWSLAEGATGFFYTYLLLGNPNTGDATATVRYQLPDGTTIEKTYVVDGQSRRTIDVRGEDALLESATIGMTITSTLPIVAERVMWWGLPFYEGSVALGSTSTGAAWAIGEGVEGGANAESTFVLVSNGSSTDGSVRFTVVYDDGTSQQKEYALAGSARLTVPMGGDFPDAQGRAFSVLVESLTDGVPITVEYSRYQNAGAGFLDGGSAALATRVR